MNYTIIIPQRNIPDLLQRCLDSIPVMVGLEVIVVDDNSDGSVVDFEHFPGLDRADVKVVFTKEGRGAGYARNVGLNLASGKYIIFADADDLFSDDFAFILDEYKDREFDVVYLNYKAVCCDDVAKSNEIRNYRKPEDFSVKNRKRLENSLRFEFGPPWCKIIRRQLLIENRIVFDECPKHNDTMFSLKVGYWARNVVLDGRVFYYNTYRTDSITTDKILDKDAWVENIMSVEMRYRTFAKQHGLRIVRWRLHNAVESIVRRQKDWEISVKVLRFLYHENLLCRFVMAFPFYCAHRILNVLIFKTKYLY